MVCCNPQAVRGPGLNRAGPRPVLLRGRLVVLRREDTRCGGLGSRPSPRTTPWEGEGAIRRPPPAVLFSAPVWPFGDWLPCRCLERAKQVHGQFGLAGDRCPRDRVRKPQLRAVKKLARKHKPGPTRLASELAIAAHR